MASIYMLITVIKSVVLLDAQQKDGYLQGEALLNMINSRIYLNIIDLVVSLLLQINQVQIIMRLFLRQSDKRLVFLVGVFTSIVSQTLWSIGKFHNFQHNAEAGKIIPAFTYLTRIAMSITYAAIFTAFLITKIKTLILFPSIWALSLLSIVLIYAPVAFFIADVSNAWVYELSEVFSVVTYVVCVVIPWEWCNKYNLVRKIQEKEGVLGRKFFEDEMYELDRFELFVEEESDLDTFGDDNSGSRRTRLAKNSSHESSETTSMTAKGSKETTSTEAELKPGEPLHDRFYNGYSIVKDGLIKFTDILIATGMAIPRSVSVGSSFGNNSAFNFNRHTPWRQREEPTANPSIQPRSAGRENQGRSRDVFVYSTQAVALNRSEDDIAE